MTMGWISERSRDFTALYGRRVESWIGVEMALRDDVGDGSPQFSDPTVPCLQLLGLQACLDGGDVLTVGIYQDVDVFGLWPRPRAEARFQDASLFTGALRWRRLTELPTGRVEYVATFADTGVLAEASLRIDARPLLLIAGELMETWDDELRFCRLDESVLVFTDPTAALQAPWTTSRSDLVQIAEAPDERGPTGQTTSTARWPLSRGRRRHGRR
ncbi:hypothetical protein KGQ20_04265 [Catenulispora sp. NF23]|uniref:hypothetical protein n=1 Tax=Catenulispora pinistramenti TaxID=2705254 RepID=UPI001BA77FEC|nr:hypothetical protein [Catenulispora pinistramenti]MBS2531978.1 hypothetical protein [Catenulispora pinistramenti]